MIKPESLVLKSFFQEKSVSFHFIRNRQVKEQALKEKSLHNKSQEGELSSKRVKTKTTHTTTSKKKKKTWTRPIFKDQTTMALRNVTYNLETGSRKTMSMAWAKEIALYLLFPSQPWPPLE